MIHLSPNFPTCVFLMFLLYCSILQHGTLAACQAHGMEFKKPWCIFGVEVLQNAPWWASQVYEVTAPPSFVQRCTYANAQGYTVD